ncbi:acyltransferase family protein [Mucilaginibacter myungsuensis]|uniref:Acyltransferase n=1 Tax=Mucilaginibacter myungsuensis TaxID=649104 RepID=A0A929KVW5_9SPHI|nr:acyltransferase [Mucilaginibacter myungsuensis]MBE9662127.1 acyltransferase [Mucilaginibacter myungsuensis]MDN3599439.1 acyltransferase [Mucilaginibacter myungsuensis]
MSTQTNTDLLKTRQHFEILDGLRGIAAISVVVFHFMEIAVPDYKESFIAHAYLAVDFFFCLSGFVIAYAYDAKLKDIGLAAFFKLRLIRLHPLVIIGSILGLLCFVFDPWSDLFIKKGIKDSVIMFVTSCFMIPYPNMPERYFNLFHLNPPSWSLFWEYIANIVYAFVFVKMNNKWTWLLLLVAAGLLCYESYLEGQLSVGWGATNFWGGPVRVFYSFVVGMLVYRSRWMIKSNLGFLPIGLLTLAAFLIPFRSAQINRVVDALVVLFYFPFLVALGAGATLRPSLKRICQWSGEISYPLYMVHYGFIWLYMSWIEKFKPTLGDMTIVLIIGTIALLLLAKAILKWVDEPIRKKLKGVMIKR